MTQSENSEKQALYHSPPARSARQDHWDVPGGGSPFTSKAKHIVTGQVGKSQDRIEHPIPNVPHLGQAIYS